MGPGFIGKNTLPAVPVEVEGEDGLVQQPLLHQDIQWGWNSVHGQNGKAKAKYPVKGGESEDQAGLPQSLPKGYRHIVDPRNLGIE